MKIESIRAIEILDSRGNPTIETTVTLDDGTVGKASVPSGASTGIHEARELRDGDKSRYGGMGVMRAVEHVNGMIFSNIKGADIDDLEKIDKALIYLDGTNDKSRLGANAILSVSLSAARATANVQKIPLWRLLNEQFFSDTKPSFPRFMVNVINGGRHANWNFDIQEYMVIPTSVSPTQSLRIASETFHALGVILDHHGLTTGKGDEGGYAPALTNNQEPLDFINMAAKTAGHGNGAINLGIDAAASEFYKDGVYTFKKEGKTFNWQELTTYYLQLTTKYNLLSLEDPFAEDDWEAFAALTRQIGDKQLVIGDDLYTTNVSRIKTGIEKKATNAVLIKPNQIGTLTETVAAIKLTKQSGWQTIISHRSGDTEDSFIADLAYSCGANFLKAGSMSRSERLAKYNRLIEIEKNEMR